MNRNAGALVGRDGLEASRGGQRAESGGQGQKPGLGC